MLAGTADVLEGVDFPVLDYLDLSLSVKSLGELLDLELFFEE